MIWAVIAISVLACAGTGYACYRWGHERGRMLGHHEQDAVQDAQRRKLEGELAAALSAIEAEIAARTGSVNGGTKEWLSRWQ